MNSYENIDFSTLKLSNSIRTGNDGVFLDLDVTPNSADAGIKGYNRWRDRITVKVRSRARKGHANTELLMLLSTFFDIELKQLSIIKGEHSTQKTVELLGLKRDEVLDRLLEELHE
jgi:uncharacterized protein (TIGR00251 family)